MEIEKIISTTCRVCGVSRNDIVGSSRKSTCVVARKIIISLTDNLPLGSVCSLLNKSHSVIIHHRKLFESDFKSYHLFSRCYSEVCNRIGIQIHNIT